MKYPGKGMVGKVVGGESKSGLSSRAERGEITKAVRVYMEVQGLSETEAKMAVLRDTLEDMHDALSYGPVDTKTKEVKGFQASLDSLLTPQEIANFRTMAPNSVLMRPLTNVSPTKKAVEAVERHFESQFQGRKPHRAVSKEYFRLNDELFQLTERLHMDPGFAAGRDLGAVLSSNPYLVGDVARIIQIQDELKRHREAFETRMDYQDEKAKLWTGAKVFAGTLLGTFFNFGKKLIEAFAASGDARLGKFFEATAALFPIAGTLAKGGATMTFRAARVGVAAAYKAKQP